MTAAPRQRPNVLFIITDQHRADHVGFGGNDVVRTPHLDALAARSTVFDRAYVANPVCMPNRSSIMTGRMPSAHGVIFNDRSLSPDATTFVGQLRDNGYRTALIGKSHLQHGMSREAVVDLPGDPALRTPWAEGWDTIEHRERYESGDTPDPEDFYGFEHIELTLGHGALSGGHHYQWALDRGVTHEQLVAGGQYDSDVPRRSPLWWQIHEASLPSEAYSTTFVTERTIDFIEHAASADDDEPWMVWCSFPDPHHPLSPPSRWLDRHHPDDMVLPATFDDPGEGWPPHLKFLRDLQPDDHDFVRPWGPTPEQARAALAATYGMIEFVDDGVGRDSGHSRSTRPRRRHDRDLHQRSRRHDGRSRPHPQRGHALPGMPPCSARNSRARKRTRSDRFVGVQSRSRTNRSRSLRGGRIPGSPGPQPSTCP